jgi:hypothetical protein
MARLRGTCSRVVRLRLRSFSPTHWWNTPIPCCGAAMDTGFIDFILGEASTPTFSSRSPLLSHSHRLPTVGGGRLRILHTNKRKAIMLPMTPRRGAARERRQIGPGRGDLGDAPTSWTPRVVKAARGRSRRECRQRGRRASPTPPGMAWSCGQDDPEERVATLPRRSGWVSATGHGLSGAR